MDYTRLVVPDDCSRRHSDTTEVKVIFYIPSSPFLVMMLRGFFILKVVVIDITWGCNIFLTLYSGTEQFFSLLSHIIHMFEGIPY